LDARRIIGMTDPGETPPFWRNDLLVFSVTILVIVASILVGYVLWTEHMLVEDEYPPMVTVGTSRPQMGNYAVGGDTLWRSEIPITKITPRDARVKWKAASVTIRSPEGASMLEDVTLRPYDPQEVDNGTDGAVDVELWYDDANGSPRIDGGDTMILTGLLKDHGGAVVTILHDGRHIGYPILPPEFS
jgi:hypothetical protein